MELRQIFNAKISPTKAMGRMNNWYEKVMGLGNNNFRSVIKTFKNHAPTILNYFRRRATDASAEAFNSKSQNLPFTNERRSRPRFLYLSARQTIRLNFNIHRRSF